MNARRRIRTARPSRARLNIRWAAIALLAMSIAPSQAPEPLRADDQAALAAEADPSDGAPRIATEGDLDGAPDIGMDIAPLD